MKLYNKQNMPSSLPAKKKPALPAKKQAGSVKTTAGPAKKQASSVKKQASPVKKQASPVKKPVEPVRKPAGSPTKKQAVSTSRKPAGSSAKKQAGTPAKKQAGSQTKKAQQHYRGVGNGIGEWKLYGIKVINPWYKDTKYVLSAPVSEGTILPVGLVGVRGEYDVRPVKGKGVFVSVHLKDDLSGLWEPRKGGIRVKLGTKKGLLLSTPPKDAFLQGDRIKKIVKEILDKIEESRYGNKFSRIGNTIKATVRMKRGGQRDGYGTGEEAEVKEETVPSNLCDANLINDVQELINSKKLTENEITEIKLIFNQYREACVQMGTDPEELIDALRQYLKDYEEEDSDIELPV